MKLLDKIMSELNRPEKKKYGDIIENLTECAELVSFIRRRHFSVEDILWVMVALKISRHMQSYQEDNIVDMVGYLDGIYELYERKNAELDASKQPDKTNILDYVKINE